MEAHGFYGVMNALAKFFATVAFVLCLTAVAGAQDQASGPLTPPPSEDHKVRRVTTTDAAAAPPSMSPTEIVKAFAEKEDRYARARGGYGYKKTIKLTEYGKDGQPSGEYQIVTAATVDDGRVYEKTVEKAQNSLHYLEILPGGGLTSLAKMPAYPLVTAQLAKYDLRYVGDEKVDEIDCYIFEAKPKLLDRATALFQGVVWVDKQYLEVVKTYGKWVNDLGPVHPQEFPFVNFETYRENVDGKYWFPNYSRSDDFVRLKDETIPVRLVIKWTDIKPLQPGAPPANTAPSDAAPPASPQTTDKPKP